MTFLRRTLRFSDEINALPRVFAAVGDIKRTVRCLMPLLGKYPVNAFFAAILRKVRMS